MQAKVNNQDLEAVRQIIRKAHTVYVPQRDKGIEGGSRRPPSSTTPLPPFAFAQTRIVELVNQSSYRDWLRFAYTDEETSAELERLAANLKPLSKIMPESRQVAATMLLTLSLMDVKRRLTQDRKLWSIRQVCSVLSLNESNWGRDYSGYWVSLRERIKRYDTEALTDLLKEVDLSQARKVGFLA